MQHKVWLRSPSIQKPNLRWVDPIELLRELLFIALQILLWGLPYMTYTNELDICPPTSVRNMCLLLVRMFEVFLTPPLSPSAWTSFMENPISVPPLIPLYSRMHGIRIGRRRRNGKRIGSAERDNIRFNFFNGVQSRLFRPL